MSFAGFGVKPHLEEAVHSFVERLMKDTGEGVAEIWLPGTTYDRLSQEVLDEYIRFKGLPTAEQRSKWMNGLIEIWTSGGRTVIRRAS